MSFLKNFLRTRQCWRRQGKTEFGKTCERMTIVKVPLNSSFYDERHRVCLWKARSQYFRDAIDKLIDKLAQTALHNDFGIDQKNLRPLNTEDENYHPTLYSFMKGKSEIHQRLNEFTGGNEREIQQWLEQNKELLANFLKSLDEIYKLRTGFAKFKDVCWELADALVAVLILVGLAAAVIKLAGMGILGGAFAHLVAPAATAKIVEGAAAGVAVAATGLFKFFSKSEEKQIREAIQQDLRLPATVQAAHILNAQHE